MKPFGWIVMCSLVAFLAATSTSWAAERGTPPQTRDCEAAYEPNEYNARLDCKTENVNSALYGFIDRVIELDGFRASIDGPSLLSKDQKDNLLAVRERAQNAKNRTNDAEGFKGAVKKQKKLDEDCYIKELSGDGDGICEKNEDCEEVMGDGIGDDDKICWPMKGKKKEVCVEICQQPLVDDEENYDSGAALDMEEELDELEVALKNADGKVDVLMRAEMNAWNQRSLQDTTLSSACGHFDATLPWISFGVMQGLQIAKNAANAAFNSCSVVCNQDAFGWNCEAACLALAIVAGVVEAVHDGTDLGFKVADEADAAAQMEKLAQCTQANKENLTTVKSDTTDLKDEFKGPGGAIFQLQKDVADLKVEGGETNDALAEIKEELALLKSLLEKNRDLLLTPQGKRDGFPLK